MFEKVEYRNHLGESFKFGENGAYINGNDLHDYAWNATKKGSRISSLDRVVSTRKLPVIILCTSESDGIEKRNKLFETVEKDALATEHGKLIVGDYYMRCFVTKSAKSSYSKTDKKMIAALTVTTDFPYWVKETTFSFTRSGGVSPVDTETVTYLDYPYDFPADYAQSGDSGDVTNSGFAGSNFKLIIYGECDNPAIYIGGQKYQVNCKVEDGEYLTIDSISKKIYLTQYDGTTVNKFSNRDKGSYIFEKIPAGSSHVLWDGTFGFDLTIIDERSEPKWT